MRFLAGMSLYVVSLLCSGEDQLKDFAYDPAVAVTFSTLVVADFVKYHSSWKQEWDKSEAQSGSFTDHAGRRFVYVLFPQPNEDSTYRVVSEICTGFGTATHEYHVSDYGISARFADELIKGYRSMKTDRTADLPAACPENNDFVQP